VRRADRMASVMCDRFASPIALSKKSAGGISQANAFILSHRAAQFYREVPSFIEFVPASPQSGADVAVASTLYELSCF